MIPLGRTANSAHAAREEAAFSTGNDTVSASVVGGDTAFRESIDRALRRAPFVSLRAPIAAVEASDQVWDDLAAATPGYLMVDLDTGREAGLRMIGEVAERKLDLRVIAFSSQVSADGVLEAIRAGASEFIPKPVDDDLLLNALLRMQRSFGLRTDVAPRRLGRLLTFFSTKGGSGVTTLACNVGVELARLTRKRVLLVDLDLRFGDLAIFLGLKPRYTLLDVLANLHRADAALLETYVAKHESGVHLLAAPESLEASHMLDADQIRRALQFLRLHYDLILVDLPNDYFDHLVASLDQQDRLLLVCTADLPSLKNVQRMLTALERLHFERQRVHVVVNRFQKGGHGVDLTAIERLVGGELFGLVPNDYPVALRAINSGIPMATTNHSGLSRAFAGMASRIVGAPEHVGPRARLRLPFFSRNGRSRG